MRETLKILVILALAGVAGTSLANPENASNLSKKSPSDSEEAKSDGAPSRLKKQVSTEEDKISLVQSAAVSSATVAPPGSAGKSSGVFGSMTVTGYSDFKETADTSKSMYSTYELSLGYKMDAKNIFSLYAPLRKNLSQDYEDDFFVDAKLSHFRRGIFRYGLLDFHHTTSFVYPTTETSKRRDEMYSGFELTPRFDLTLNKYVKGLMLIYMPRYRRRFHKYTSNRAGDYLVNESFLNILVASWSFAPKFAFESTLVYVQNRRYDGVMTDDSYMTVQELQYAFSNKVFLSLGVQTGGAIINPERGRSQTIEIFDANMSEFYTGARVVF